jgi:glycosyltransferase involved in cell wall biosynthesis
MLSVIIPTLNCERALVPTLAALVSGATAGLITQVAIADGGSKDDTAKVADVAGCSFAVITGPLGFRLKTAAAAARAQWLLFLRPGTVPDTSWVSEVGRFIQHPANRERAAVFRRDTAMTSAFREFAALTAAALGARPRRQQGLLIAKPFYEALGGHAVRAGDPEDDLLRRIGRRRIVRLATGASEQILD